MDRTTEALNYIRERYFEEQARFNHLEDKCGKLVTLLTISIAAYGSLVVFKSDSILKSCTELEWIISAICIASFFAMACSWGHALLALKMGGRPVAAKSRKNAEYLYSASDEDAIQQMFDCYVNTTEELGSVIDLKATNLEHAYNELSISAWLVAIFAILIVIKELFA